MATVKTHEKVIVCIFNIKTHIDAENMFHLDWTAQITVQEEPTIDSITYFDNREQVIFRGNQLYRLNCGEFFF